MRSITIFKKLHTVIAVITAMAVMALCSICLVACGEEHEFVNYVYNNDATCGMDGTETGVCKDCGKTNTRKSKAYTATGDHVFEDYVCSVCFEYAPDAPISDDLAFDKIKKNGKVVAYEVTGIGEADDDVLVPNTFNKKPVTSIGYAAFENCNYLKSIAIPSSVTTIDFNAFDGCNNLKRVRIANGLTYIGWYAFDECRSLEVINIPNSVTFIGISAFYRCSKLSDISIPDSVTHIGDRAFEQCDSLRSIELPDSVTEIDEGIFSYCKNLKSITLSGKVTKIEMNAFWGCERLTEIKFDGTVKKWRSIKKGSSWNYNTGNYTVICTDGVLSKAES